MEAHSSSLHQKNKLCIPGDRLFAASAAYVSGAGSHVTHGYIYSSLAGFVNLIPDPKNPQIFTVEVHRGSVESKTVPTVGCIVTARVTNLTPLKCKCSIVCVERSTLTGEFTGHLRREDVRSKDIDNVEMHLCYRPGDIIIARVTSMGDTKSSFWLSTAQDELGVIVARSEDGHPLVATSWTQMQCPVTKQTYARKVAQVPHHQFHGPARKK